MSFAFRKKVGVPRFSPDQTRLLVVLTLVNFVNYLDRQLIFPLFSLIREDFALSYFQVGWLAAAFSIIHALGAVPLGMLADRTSRKRVISYALLFWSGATFLSGLANSFRSLLVARGLVGMGEAAYAPAATAIISGTFARRVRARVQGVFDTGMFVGGAVGLALGGILADGMGWRPAFFIVGIPGLLLGLTIVRLPETPGESGAKSIPILQLLRVPAFVAVLAGGLFVTFAGNVYVIWGTEFLRRFKGFGLGEAGISLGVVAVAAGILGVTTGAVLADRLAGMFPWGRVLTICAGFLVSAPFILWALHTPGKAAFLGLFFLGSFFMSWYYGPVTATIHDLVPARAHATAMGVYCFFVNFFATTLAPTVIGKIADRYDLLTGMHTAVAAQVAGGLCFFVVIYCIRGHGLRHPALAQVPDEPGLAAGGEDEPLPGRPALPWPETPPAPAPCL